MKTLLQGGQVITSKRSLRADILLEGSRIAALGPNIGRANPKMAEGAEIVDVSGKFLFPGGVDAHTHITLDLEAARGGDVFYQGTVPAALGGTTCIVDHLSFRPDNSSLESELADYLALAGGRAAVDYTFHGLLQDAEEPSLKGLEILPRLGLKSVKAYMTYQHRLDDRELFKTLQRTRELGLVLVVHAENHACIKERRRRFEAEGRLAPIWHARSRPPECEAKAVARVLALARQAGDAPVYIAHLSSAAGLEAVRQARQGGQRDIYVETCTQYLTFTEEEYLDPEAGLRFIMAPPLRERSDVEALWQGLAGGEIQVVASDHCSFTLSDKARGRGDFTRCPGGAPGLNERLAAMFSRGVLTGRISPQKFVEVTATAPAEIFGLAGKGRLEPGADADLVVFDPARSSDIFLPGPDDFSIYAGLGLKGRVEAVYLRGRRMVLNGVYTGQKGQGEFQHNGEHHALP